ncbi:MAG: LacI family DNA-binding transcriptional regulator [Chloroflexi bacterium]|nr:LacI family DNA-binding transcriptional regulator [Chloroflexota bacterium]
MRKKSITMTDVARRAGVSISTVSRVVSGSVNVSDQLRKRVDAAIAEMEYQPIRVGSRYSATDDIAVLIPNVSSPFFHSLIQGIQSICFDKGHTLQVYSSGDDPEKEMIHADELAERSDMKGVIFAGAWTWEHQEPIRKLEATGMPICLINRFAPDVKADLLEVEREQGTYDAAVHLLQLGHTRIGCITAIPNASTNPDHVTGFRRALEDHQIETDEDLIIETHLSAKGGYDAGLELLTRKHRPSAILARTDRLAIGAMRAAWELRISIPEELSIIGYDDEPDARFMRPALTTIRQPQYEMGTRATNLLFERIANPELLQRQVIVQPQLIVRETTMAPRTVTQPLEETATVQ